ncbi:3-hydroxyacyl-CoA dehydrogenase NAD-binding domain-containing protein [Bradyrhizobium sp. USDA 223]|uniref:3-hydroxyacyl-CoA dehydrogenase NAD-binding domain-containing protein n=1 Tax=Bradyrhizobium sp. USDA 223 TaxID=3156306 RepID=UPI0038393455
MLEKLNPGDKWPHTVGLLGGGVIGSGWAARFILNGVDVRLYSPSRGVTERVQEMLTSARRAYRQLAPVWLPPEGSLTVVDSVTDAVWGVDLVQESAPERLELKQKLLAAAGRAAAPGTLICSSTSGFRPSLLQAEMESPDCMLVAHPFQPVYLLPLVELCAGERTAPEALERAAAIYQAIGMHPLVLRREVDGFIANRLQDALSREALWLVRDDVATLQEIDDAVRYSWALRRAAIGSYRMANGGAGMRQSIAQWAFKWPWSRLTEKPEMDSSFLDKVAEQADAQVRADPLPLPAEQMRDELLVALLHGLRSQSYGPGETLNRWERRLRDRASSITNPSSPLRTRTRDIPADWMGDQGPLNESRYLQLFGDATDILLRSIGVNDEYRSKHGRYRTLETHMCHLGELYAGDRAYVLTQVLGVQDNCLHLFHVLTREGDAAPVATREQMLLHVAPSSGSSESMQRTVRDRAFELARLHADLPGRSANLRFR